MKLNKADGNLKFYTTGPSKIIGYGKSGVIHDVFEFEKELKKICLDNECYRITVNRIAQDDAPTGLQNTENDDIIVNALCNLQNELIEILLSKAVRVPRIVIRCISAVCPYLKQLTKISILRSRLNMPILCELKCILMTSSLTDICLDGSFLPEANYDILLDESSTLRYLSLSRCCIDDKVCELITSRLHWGFHGNLLLLNLSSNRITDAGANSLAQALRTNRTLRYLNLAGNHITDTGALSLLDVLMKFPLTYSEIVQRRERYGTYLKTKMGVYLQHVQDDVKSVESDSNQSTTINQSVAKKETKASTVSVTSSKSDKSNLKLESTSTSSKLEQALDLLGPFVDPFDTDSMLVHDGVSYCRGNFVLAYLNLAYNNVSYLTVKRLTAVKLYQQDVKKADGGIMKVILNGNCLPEYCEEYDIIGPLIVHIGILQGKGKRKSVLSKSGKK